MTRMRTTWPAMAAALLLVLAFGATALGATLVPSGGDQQAGPATAPLVGEGMSGFVDADGDGIADECDDDVIADPEAAASAEAAIDLDGDGDISVQEAAQSDRTGGTNCNHGGYVSTVAQQGCAADESTDAANDDGAEAETAVETTAESDETDEADEADEVEADTCDDADADADEAEADAETKDAAECTPVAAPTLDPTTLGKPGGFGAYVSSVAQSDAIGGKNCNHGGAVSEAVKAAKAEAKTARDAAKAERSAARAEAKAERAAAKAAKVKKGGGAH
jgi:hypothetical protein